MRKIDKNWLYNNLSICKINKLHHGKCFAWFFIHSLSCIRNLTHFLCSLVCFLILLNSWIKSYAHIFHGVISIQLPAVTGMCFPYLWHTFKKWKKWFFHTQESQSLFTVFIYYTFWNLFPLLPKFNISDRNLKQNSTKTNITHRDEASAHVGISYTKCSFIYGLQQIRAKGYMPVKTQKNMPVTYQGSTRTAAD